MQIFIQVGHCLVIMLTSFIIHELWNGAKMVSLKHLVFSVSDK